MALVVAVGMAAAVTRDGTAEASHNPKPNVVVIMTDDQDLRSLEVMRKTREALGQRGTSFRNYFATYPLCCPSRATLLTGQYAHNHGVMSNDPPTGGYETFDDSGSLGITLNAAGYRTGWIGKYLNGYGSNKLNPRTVPRGWSEWFGLVHGTYDPYGYTLNQNGQLRTYGSRNSDYQTDVLAQKARNFIGQSADLSRPFFLTLAPSAPHTRGDYNGRDPRPAPRHSDHFEDRPLDKSPSFDEADVSDKPRSIRNLDRLSRGDESFLRELNQDRLASLLAVDDAVDSVVNKLRAENELGNTLIMFTSDNGYLLGEHRKRGKRVLYEEAAKVPLLMRGPGVPQGGVRDQIVGNIDLAPTILDIANAPARRQPDGRSLIPFAQNPAFDADRDILFETSKVRAVRTPNHMWADHPDSEKELYDLGKDPFQLESRHEDPSYGPVRQRLRDRLGQLENCAGVSCSN